MRRAVAAVGGALAALILVGGSARADVGVRGSVAGNLARGARATFSLTASHSEGWQSLDRISVALELRGALLEEISYDLDTSSIDVGGARAVAGTGNIASGRFFRIGAFGVEVGTGGDRVRLGLPVTVLAAPPPGARFRFSAEADDGERTSSVVAAAVEDTGGGLSAVTVSGAVVAALVAGGVIGSRLARHRRGGPSVYDSVARRLREDERPPPRPVRR
jgi:hypothetical protein